MPALAKPALPPQAGGVVGGASGILVLGDWPAERITAERAPSTFAPGPGQEAAIAETWTRALARPGVHLFDGPLCRLESWRADAGDFRIAWSPTSYRLLIGTNAAPGGDRLPGQRRADPLGVSALVETADGRLALGVRAANAALCAGLAHTFGGCPEPAEPLRPAHHLLRELDEELGLAASDLADLRAIALLRSPGLATPELLFHTRVRLTAAALAARLAASEHQRLHLLPATAQAADAAAADPALTGLARVGLAAWAAWRAASPDRPAVAPPA